ncbi:MAG: NYN domain-containing protein [Achromobacter sp.]|uniref:NYN domain-containing protein n=1 Tax=Achromobacter sp. TaxID=134375 RepID=UPI0012CA8F2A|nr:NYN domain-containing protein [Achromobacter sp.]
MTTPNENVSMALFCDFENVALGVRDTKYQKFDIRPVLERLLLKGSIVVKKAYCDWERYKEFKAPMHEANFELIEIPHVRQSGKNSADIRLVVDALDFCYTKSHVNTFVIISGDSDFSPLVSKLRENNKKVIGVGVKQSTSDLLIANCDEFIFYDDLAREIQRTADARRDNRGGANAGSGQRRTPDEESRRKEELEARKTQAVDMVVETFEALMAERGDSGKIWASALKDALKRRKPDFNESYYGFRAFGNLLDEAQSRGFLDVGREEKSGTYVYRDSNDAAPAVNRAGSGHGARAAQPRVAVAAESDDAQADTVQEETQSRSSRKSRGGRRSGRGNSLPVEQGVNEVVDAAPAQGASEQASVAADSSVQAPAVAEAGSSADEHAPVTARDETRGGSRNESRNESRSGSRNSSRNNSRHGARNEGRNEARNEGGNEARNEGRNEGRNDARHQSANDARDDAPSNAAQDAAAAAAATAAAEEAARDAAVEAAKVEAMRADALARAQASKPVQPSRLPPMPTPLPQARQPLPAVDIAEWTFVEAPAESRRESASKTPAKVSDPFEGASARAAAESAARAAATPEPAKAAAQTATKTATKSATKTPAKTATKTATKTAAKTATKTAAKTATKTASKTTAKSAAKSASPAADDASSTADATPAKTASRARRSRKTDESAS